MKKLKAFWYIFVNSLTSTHYYKDILTTPFSFSIKYLAILAIISSLIVSFFTTLLSSSELKSALIEGKNTIVKTFPEDLEFKIEDNKWSINKQEPYAIKTPNEILEYERNISEQTKSSKNLNQYTYENLIIFNSAGTINDFKDLDTLMLMNSNNLLVKEDFDIENENNTENYNVVKLDLNEDITINKDFIEKELTFIDTIVKYIEIIYFSLGFILYFSYFFVFILAYLLFVAFALLIVNIFVKPTLDFKELYRIALHSATLSIVLQVILFSGLTSLNIGIPWFFILNVIIGTMVIFSSAKIDE